MYFGNYCECLNSFKTCFKILWWLICWSFILSVFAEGTSPQKVSTQVQGSAPRTAEEVQFQLPVEIAVRIQKMLDAHCLLHFNAEYAVWREWEASCGFEILGMMLSYAQRVGETVACGLFRKCFLWICTSEVLSVGLMIMSPRKSAVNDKKAVICSVTDCSVVMWAKWFLYLPKKIFVNYPHLVIFKCVMTISCKI